MNTLGGTHTHTHTTQTKAISRNHAVMHQVYACVKKEISVGKLNGMAVLSIPVVSTSPVSECLRSTCL